MLVEWGPPNSLYRVHINHGIFSHFLAKEGMRIKLFFRGAKIFFLQEGGGEGENFFSGAENFFLQEGGGGERRRFFLGPRIFFKGRR
jgi:hypothetical protein